jgi:flagellar protein FlaD
LTLSKDQLYELVEKIQNVMTKFNLPSEAQQKAFKKPEFGNQQDSYEPNPIVENADMKRLYEAIEKLENKIRIIEEHRLPGIENKTGKLVKTEDISMVDDTKSSSLQEQIEPLCEIPNDPESIIVLMKWLQYLVDKLGKNNLPDVLGYYVDIDWISDDVRLDLIRYSKGITDEKKKDESKKEIYNLTTRDHIQSLLFIQKLKGKQLDDRFMSRIDREMEKMTKSINEYQSK